MTRAILALATVTAFAGGLLVEHRDQVSAGAPAAGPHARRILYYVDPMHPAYTSTAPGQAPDCGMALQPVYENEQPAEGALRLGPARRQAIGVRVEVVHRADAIERLRSYGRVAADETRTYRVDAGVSGSLRELSGVTSGSVVTKDQWLATLSSPDLRSPLQGYLVALDLLRRSKAAGENSAQIAATAASADVIAERLLTMGVSRHELDEIARAAVVPPAVRITAPAAGFVLSRSVVGGQALDRGQELFRIADLSRVWILAEVFGPDAALVRPGMAAAVTIPGRGQVMDARVSADLLPQFDATTQSSRVRIDVANPSYLLRPDMFVDVELPIAHPDAIDIPADAVRDTGLEQRVFVERDGDFVPRRVRVGRRSGGRVEILEGLSPGERIAVSGTFLLDAESRLPRQPSPPSQ